MLSSIWICSVFFIYLMQVMAVSTYDSRTVDRLLGQPAIRSRLKTTLNGKKMRTILCYNDSNDDCKQHIQ
jgi:hypothetical protein